MPTPVPAPLYAPDGPPYNYIVVVDAGSKGTRAYLYAYTATHPEHLFTMPAWHRRIRPSIESVLLASGTTYRNVSLYLSQLLYNINALVPASQHYRTPIFFHSTAGFRQLEPDTQATILSHVCNYLRTSTNYYIPHCDTHVSVLTGELEGLYSWIALNHLLSTTTDSNSTSLLQLGGGSAQIVYQTSHPIHSFNGLTLQWGQQDKINLFSNSYYGFGLNQIRQEYQQSLLSTPTSLTSTSTSTSSFSYSPLIDPCLPGNYASTVSIDDNKYTFTGSADFSTCTNLIYDQISANIDSCAPYSPFQHSQCMIPSYADYNSTQSTTFYAISGYSKVVKDIESLFDLPHQQTISSFQSLTQQLCSSTIIQLHDLPNTEKFNDHKISSLCFNAIYVQALLQTGFNIPVDSPNLHFQHNFNNSKFSWTLGTALLYALDENSNNNYGFTYNLNPNTFINGAEQVGVPTRPQFDPNHTYEPITPINQDFNPDETEIIIQNSYPWIPIISIFSILLLILALVKLPHLRRRIYSLLRKPSPNNSNYLSKYNDSNLELALLPSSTSEVHVWNDLDLDPDPDIDIDTDLHSDSDNDSDIIERAL